MTIFWDLNRWIVVQGMKLKRTESERIDNAMKFIGWCWKLTTIGRREVLRGREMNEQTMWIVLVVSCKERTAKNENSQLLTQRHYYFALTLANCIGINYLKFEYSNGSIFFYFFPAIIRCVLMIVLVLFSQWIFLSTFSFVISSLFI